MLLSKGKRIDLPKVTSRHCHTFKLKQCLENFSPLGTHKASFFKSAEDIPDNETQTMHAALQISNSLVLIQFSVHLIDGRHKTGYIPCDWVRNRHRRGKPLQTRIEPYTDSL